MYYIRSFGKYQHKKDRKKNKKVINQNKVKIILTQKINFSIDDNNKDIHI